MPNLLNPYVTMQVSERGILTETPEHLLCEDGEGIDYDRVVTSSQDPIGEAQNQAIKALNVGVFERANAEQELEEETPELETSNS
jgi:hypothetical protein